MDQSSTTIPEYSSPTLLLKIFSNPLNKSNEPSILISHNPELKKEIVINEPSIISLNIESNKTIITPLEGYDSCKKKSQKKGKYDVLVEVIPRCDDQQGCYFDLRRSLIGNQFNLERIHMNTFVQIGSSGRMTNRICLIDKDIIKFGRQVYKIHLGSQLRNENVVWNAKMHKQQTISEQEFCKICFEKEGQDENDELISPCSCAGSCGTVHLFCLRKWIRGKLLIKENEKIKTYNFNKYTCEVCRVELPKYISINGKISELVPLQFGKQVFAILERIAGESNIKLIHCIQVNSGCQLNTLTLGRNQSNDIILQDMSVSRFHAKISIQNQTLKLQDNQSKFGTFVNLRGTLSQLQQVNLMTNRWTFNLSLGYQV